MADYPDPEECKRLLESVPKATLALMMQAVLCGFQIGAGSPGSSAEDETWTALLPDLEAVHRKLDPDGRVDRMEWLALANAGLRLFADGGELNEDRALAIVMTLLRAKLS